MTDTRPWWPQGYGDDPAFQVRRIVYGSVTGGDYVRGSSVLTLPHTAVRFPTAIPGVAAAVGRAVLHVRVKNHYTRKEAITEDGVVQRYITSPVGDIEVTWGWPSTIEDTWLEVALVRSAFGRPSTVNDGQTVMRGFREAFYQQVAGTPVLDEDGNPTLILPPLVTDTGLPTGRWYHYGLFFRVSEVEWIQGMLDSTLLPRDHHHSEHLWSNVPPYYRWTDENSMVGNGHLRQFLDVFAFELDTTREYVESWQHVYDVDWSPIRLLRKLGDNFGVPYEQGIGDIRYRSLLCDIGSRYNRRGTQRCLEETINHLAKYACDITGGSNLMLLPDDSDFATGIGNWGVVLDTVDAPGSGYLAKDKVWFGNNTLALQPPPPGIGRRSMRIYTYKADNAADIGIACGASYHYDVFGVSYTTWTENTAISSGIPVIATMSYGFSVWVNSAVIPTAVQVSLLWFDGKGNYLSASSSTAPSSPVTAANTWQMFSLGATYSPPANAVYAVPYILFDTRTDSGAYPSSSPPLDIAGVMVYASEAVGQSVGPPPNRYLTVGDPGEVLGDDLTFKGTLTGAGTALPTGATLLDAYVLTPAPVPTAAPQFLGVTPARAAAANDTIYWNGTAWINAGPIPNTWVPFLLGAPS